MRPTGEFVLDDEMRARTSLLLYQTGNRMIRLADVHLPDQPAGVTLGAQLYNPHSTGDATLSHVGAPCRLDL
jgi:hypothetical protein